MPHPIRHARPGDRNLILHSWIRELRVRGPSWIRSLPEIVYVDVVPRIVRGLLDSCTARVVVSPEDDDTILGWACSDESVRPPMVHYVWIKQAFRGYGLGRALVEAMPDGAKSYSVSTRAVTDLQLSGHLSDWRFVPLALLEHYQ